MGKFKLFYLHNFKIIIFIGLCIEFGLGIYCYQESKDNFFSTILSILFYCILFLLYLLFANRKIKLSNKQYESFKNNYKFSYLLLLILLANCIIGFIYTIFTKKFGHTRAFIPLLVGFYCTVSAEKSFASFTNLESDTISTGSNKQSFIKLSTINFKKTLLYALLITVVSIIYCLPMTIDEVFDLMKLIIVLSCFSYLLRIMAKLNNFTGATELLHKYFPIKYSFYLLPIFFCIISILGIVLCIFQRKPELVMFLIPSVVGLYNANKATLIIQKEIDDLERIANKKKTEF